MRVINARNVHQALPLAVQLLEEEGVRRDSRNGPVIMAPFPVATVYREPQERVLFWPQRDANPALHLYEALWMLAGRNDVAPLMRYAKRFGDFSDDGRTLHDAYGYRWRHAFLRLNQLSLIAQRLRDDRDDRRCVIQMWDAAKDLGRAGRAVPCNLTATVQVSDDGRLDLTVFCRSNDVIWGCYGANGVHFSLLQEYLAVLVGVPVGTYTQISVNWHAYLDTLEPVKRIPRPRILAPSPSLDPYERNEVVATPLTGYDYGSDWRGAMLDLDESIKFILDAADDGFPRRDVYRNRDLETWESVALDVLSAHHAWRTLPAPERYETPLRQLSRSLEEGPYDWLVAMKEWLERRFAKWREKQ